MKSSVKFLSSIRAHHPSLCFTLLFLSLCFAFANLAVAANVAPTLDYVVQASASVTTSPPTITISWPADSRSTSYKVSRRLAGSSTWGAELTVPGTASTLTAWTDTSVSMGVAYEYRIVRTTSIPSGVVPPYTPYPTLITAYGYLSGAINLPMPDQRGKVILLVDQTMATPLVNELTRLTGDLVADGWSVIRHDVSRTETVPNIKSLIVTDYQSDPTQVKAVFLFGHIPVPYSGYVAFDGHDQHDGAWATDTFYADMDGTWTDTSANTTGNATQPTYAENINVPGDGKFDQIYIPTSLELAVGRVDFAGMPTQVSTFGLNETELLRQYLNKDHKHRTGEVRLPRRGIVDDTNFGSSDGQAFSQTGWRASSSLFGASGTSVGTMRDLVTNGGALFYYVNGPGGVGGCANYSSSNFSGNPRFAFMINFGSWFGDFDKSNNFERAALCSTTGLTNSWGAANFFLHSMALGSTIGEAHLRSQNNDGVDYALTYFDYYSRTICSSLMGDPTLRLLAVTPPSALSITQQTQGHPALSWTASPEATMGYSIYRAATAAGPFVKIVSGIKGTLWTDISASGNNTYVYQVKAAKLETLGGGSFINTSLAATGQIAIGTPANPVITGLNPAGGTILGGNILTITGSKLTSASSVSVGGVAVTPTVLSDTQIQCVTPAHAAGLVSVSVTTPGGTVTQSNSFTYATAVPTVTGVSPSNTSWTGTTVTLTGTNLADTSSVTFGGTSATILSTSATQVKCTLPARAPGTVNIVLTAPGGSVTKTNGFVYAQPDSGGFYVLPKAGTTAGGTAVTITAFNVAGTPSVTFGGVAATSINVINSNQLTCVTPPGTAGNVSVSVSHPGGATRTATAYTYTTSVPIVTSVNAGTGPASGGTKVTINGSNLVGHGLSAVTFGGVMATELIQVSSSQVTCVTPAHAPGAVNVVYTNLDGQTTLANGFTYSVPADSTPPVLSSISSGTPTLTSATITWSSNENSDSQVQYGTTSSYGFASTLNSSGVSSHSVSLAGLSSNTLYHYRVLSKDGSGNLSISSDHTFMTVTPPFAAWANLNFTNSDLDNPLISTPLADADQDGIPNLTEYYIGTNPKAITPSWRPSISLDEGYLILTYEVDRSKTDLILVPQQSSDLNTWNSNGIIDTIIESSGMIDTHEAAIPVNNSKAFLRLKQVLN